MIVWPIVLTLPMAPMALMVATLLMAHMALTDLTVLMAHTAHTAHIRRTVPMLPMLPMLPMVAIVMVLIGKIKLKSMSKKAKIIISILILFLLGAIVFLGGYYFSWQEARSDCFTFHEKKFEEACDSLKNIESKASQCMESGDVNCIDLLNYKLFYYLLARGEKNETTDKICREVFALPKNDVSQSQLKNAETFCDDFSETLQKRDLQSCDLLFGDDLSRNYCRFLLTADRQYCSGDQQKCADRAILFDSFLNKDFSRCNEITDFNTRVACQFFNNFKADEDFSCQGSFVSEGEFFKGELFKTLCKDLY